MSVTTTTHLNFRGTAREALDLYPTVTYQDAGTVAHESEADWVMWGRGGRRQRLPHHGLRRPLATPLDPGREPVFLSVRGDDTEGITALWTKLAEGSTIVRPLEPAQWAVLYDMLTDRFGVTWVLDVTVRVRKLGRTGVEVSAYCLGTMMFGKLGNPDHDDRVRIVHRALEAGVDFVDTADVHGYGETEEIVGKALKGRRDEVVLATKCNGPMGEGPNHGGSSRRWIIQAVEGSLERLRTDYIDLYQIHHPDPHTDIEETLSALTDLVRAGKVRAIGSSNLPASEIVEAQWVSRQRGLHHLRAEQPTYSVLNRGIEREVLPTCRRHGLGVLVWGPRTMDHLDDLLTGATHPRRRHPRRDRRHRPARHRPRPARRRPHTPSLTHTHLRRRPPDERAAA